MATSKHPTLKELRALPQRGDSSHSLYDFLFIIPATTKNSSGYSDMLIVGVKDEVKEIACVCDNVEWNIPDSPIHKLKVDILHPSKITRFFSNAFKFHVETNNAPEITLIPILNNNQ